MKQKTNSFVLVVAVIGFAASSWSANQLYTWKNTMTPYQAKVPTQFYAGMDKFLSNISWMTLIQWQADDMQTAPSQVTDKLYEKLNALTNLDPLFADAYLDGALSLSTSHPDQSLQLLDKALDMGMDQDWKLAFYAGQICMMSKKDPQRAAQYFATSAKAADAPDYVESALLHAECAEANDDSVASMKLWYNYYQTLSGSDNAARRKNALDQINEYATTGTAEVDQELQAKPSGADRDAALQKRAAIAKIIKDANSPQAPTTQPEI